ncbi:diguanylate cyclase [Geomesophilobacter sediminis]|uniref:diguanylate cyclase n=1 Tax=Geomesophilobacter sediminis TaxID=2798584 RepID=A0A8J7M342_9BACT|nr:diguanylate cyclase [Geomesophilobacter sediminis]MBJ6727383.1 diguanylate cyclase [Geomesophilobacter sediminis]
MATGIQRRITRSISIYLVIVTSLSCWGAVFFSTRLARESIQKQQFALTELVARSIDDKLGANMLTITQLADKIPPGALSDSVRAQAFLDSNHDLLSIFDNGLLLFDRKHQLIAESPFRPGRRGSKTVLLDQFLTHLESLGLPDISQPYVSPKSGSPSIVIAVPIDSGNGIQGFLAGSISLTKDIFLEEVMGYKIGKRGYLYLFDRNRDLILHPDKTRILKHDIPPGVNKLLDRALAGFEGSGETVNSRGIPQVVSVKRLRMADWILAASYPQDEAYEKIKSFSFFLVAGAVFVSAISVALVRFLTRRVTANLNSFTAQIKQMKKNPGSCGSIRIDGDDEISVLAETFNELMSEVGAAREQLDELSRTDHLTGLSNRRHLELEAPKLFALAKRQSGSTAVLMLDIDHFKKVNDGYGHDVGDVVLVQVASLLRGQVRPYDLVVRFGGEEFLLFLPLIGRNDALKFAERVRLSIAKTPIQAGDQTLTVTASIGLHVTEESSDLAAQISKADCALYQAKNGGRNRVCLFNEP